jgi:SAM-dependent methyltransferase
MILFHFLSPVHGNRRPAPGSLVPGSGRWYIGAGLHFNLVRILSLFESVLYRNTDNSKQISRRMDQPVPNLHFTFMSLLFKVRDFLLPRRDVLKDVGIKGGFHILDYGCGPGSYIVPVSEWVGDTGRIYTLDIHPMAIRKVQEIIRKKNLSNVETILSDCKTGLPDESIDVTLLYDIFHVLSDPDGILKELHRVLKPEGILSFSDHHMKENEILARVTKDRLFMLLRKNRKTYSFSKGKTS